ncbi:nuclear transport factor 2 family protein [Mucilaginibacter defluvii]|uniref:SnoaL-like domain-containing protein n=1 Tax=Mucilaginibacter defluvii TaxID=1196019 RepID=A0ABP9FPY4_9SPHI
MTNIEILVKANQAFSSGNYEELLTYCTEDTKWTYIGDSTLDGKENVYKFLLSAYADTTFGIEKYVEDGETIITIGRIKLMNKDGKLTDSPFCDVWKFRNGKMSQLIRSFASENWFDK